MMQALPTTNRETTSQQTRRAVRRGITLLELLIVITILALVTATTIPLMLSGVDQRKSRETARLVSSYFASAKARAIETGRPAGVLIQRSAGGLVAGGASINLYTVECPQLYAGDTLSSVVTVANGSVTFNPPTSSFVDNYATNVHVGDIIRFGYQGRTYFLTGNGSQSAGQALSSSSSGLTATDASGTVAPSMPNGVSYQVMRQPTKSAVAPLQLPEGVVIDLAQSGWGMVNYFNVDGNPIIITFAPNGAVDEVYYGGQLLGHMVSPLCLLIGKPDQVGTGQGTDANALDGNSLWVAVTPQGRVITAENAINNAASTFAGNRAFIYGYGSGTGGTGGITTSAGGG